NVVFLPSSPALIAELAPNDEPSRRLLNKAIELLPPLVQEHSASVEVVCSHDQRWYTAHQGSFRAWGAPQVDVGQGHYLGEVRSPRSWSGRTASCGLARGLRGGSGRASARARASRRASATQRRRRRFAYVSSPRSMTRIHAASVTAM